jgi:selenide,water dikinase
VGPADLEELIGDICIGSRADVLVGPGDDAGVQLIGEQGIVQTVDVITPVVNDPFIFGAISAANSMSDVYAMGGKPLSALAVAGFPSCEYEPVVFKEIMKGAISALEKAGAVLIGGHSFDDSEIKFGLCVTGIVDTNRILRARGASAGDVLVLTKPVGTGILTTALKGGKLTESDIREVVESMLVLNDQSSLTASIAGANACTDVTGFGLLGHAFNMVKDSQTDFLIKYSEVPLFQKVYDMVDAGMVPEGAYHNLRFLDGKVWFPSDFTEEKKLILSDPQTSGGLLIAVPQASLRAFESSSLFSRIIGKVVRGSGKIIVE